MLCQRALGEAEILQKRAYKRNAFSCQTLLLGVQADLILQQLGSGRGTQAIADLKAVSRDCSNF
ncbi:hypothetical protein CREGCYN_14800 [Synechococcus sp. M16CYN]